MARNAAKHVDLASKFKIKRSGKDDNDIFYSFGKVHGLENIAYIDNDKLA